MISQSDIDKKYLAMKEQAESWGYHLNPDETFAKELVHGILTNVGRYGFDACPCRLCIGPREDNLDIICPCDYRDQDLTDFGICYCALYVSKDIATGKMPAPAIPDRRPPLGKCEPKKAEPAKPSPLTGLMNLPFPVYRCRVCGYLCARKNPPSVCPICGVSADRFEKYIE
ncbi:MAG: ferredoxin-thioredoxin reductase catalytic domain-containing protein [Methanogenium sp.]